MNVEVRFTGLCAFVRNTNGQTMRVVLIEPSASPCDKHEPALLVPDSIWDQSKNKRNPTDSFFDEDYFETVHVLPLSQEDLVFPAGATALSLRNPGALPDCPVVLSDSFDWVPKISDFTTNGAMLNSVLTGASPSGVASRIRISSGEFSTLGFRNTLTPIGLKIIKFGFKSGGVIKKKALAEEVLLTDSVSGSGDYIISATGFGGTAGLPITLTPSGGLVGFKVVDLPLDKIKNPAGADAFARDDCFAEFYSLGVSAGGLPVPLRKEFCDPTGGAGLSNPKCPSAVFVDNTNA